MQQANTAQAKELEKKKQNLPQAIDLEGAAGEGQEFITAKDTKLPILKILYANSPVLNDDDGKYIERAKQGDIYNEVTGSLWKGKEGIIVVPCLYYNTFNEWKDRGDGPGRPVKIHTDPAIMSETSRGEDNKDRLPNGNYLENTANHYVILLGKTPTTALISMKATQLKVSRKWNSMMMGIKLQGKDGLFTPPTYSHIYKLKTVQMSNDKGTWFGWDVSKIGPVTDKSIYEIAKTFAARVGKGEIQAKPEADEAKRKTLSL